MARKIRIHKDITFRWRVRTDGQDVSLEGRKLEVLISDRAGNAIKMPFAVSDINRLIFVWLGKDQYTCGKYTVSVFENPGAEGSTCLDEVDAVELVRRTCQEGDSSAEGLDTETVDLDGDLVSTGRGASAYEVWLMNGHTGTEQDFLDSLKGEKGDPGVTMRISVCGSLLKFEEGDVAVEGTKLII